MSGSVIRQLILKDWRLHQREIWITIAVGAAALMVLQYGREVTFVVGSVWFFVALMVLGTMLPMSAIVSERKKQNLAFVMSLPVSAMQYTTAKLLAAVGMFLAPWLTLLVAALLLVKTRAIIPAGAIPTLIILALLPVVGFCIISATALVGESEGWGIAANVVCNSSYGVVWYLITQVKPLTVHWKDHAAVWNATALKLVCSELGVSVLLVALAFFLQSRKRDFI